MKWTVGLTLRCYKKPLKSTVRPFSKLNIHVRVCIAVSASHSLFPLSGVMWHLVPLAWKKLHFWLGQCITQFVWLCSQSIQLSGHLKVYKTTVNSLNKDHTLKTIIQIKSLWDKRLKCLFNIFSVELRELEAKLKAGFMNRERAAQLAEKRAMALDSKVRCNVDIFSKLYVLLVLIL